MTETTPRPKTDPEAPINLDALPARAKAAALRLMFPLTAFSRRDLATKAAKTMRGWPNCGPSTVAALRQCLAEADLRFADERPGFRGALVNVVATCWDRARTGAPPLAVRLVQTGFGIAVQPLGPDGSPLFVMRLEYHQGRVSAGVVVGGVDMPVHTLTAEEVFRGSQTNQGQGEGGGLLQHGQEAQAGQEDSSGQEEAEEPARVPGHGQPAAAPAAGG